MADHPTPEENLKLCDGIASAMLINLEEGHGADTMMLTHGLRDLANMCADLQRQVIAMRS